MILSAAKVAKAEGFDADICIVGSGPAGISMAMELAAGGKSVLLVTGGGEKESVADRDLYRGFAEPAGTHEPLEENRRRQFGGTSAAWNGRCIPFEPIDFEERPWVKDSGWPFSYDELLPFYRKAAELCQIGAFVFDAREAFPATGEIIPGLDGECFVSHPLERWSPPVKFAVEYRSVLEKSPLIRVLLDTHLISLGMDDGPDAISHAKVIALGKRLKLTAREYVLATGGIETPRILLASANAHCPNGIGNQHDNVGRYYMTHLFGIGASVDPKGRSRMNEGFEMHDGVYCRRRWWLTAPAQKEHRLLNTIFFLYRSAGGVGHRDPMFSAIFVAKSVKWILAQKTVSRMAVKAKELLPGIRQHLLIVIREGVPMLPSIFTIARKRFARRRLPYVLPSRNTPHWGLFYQAEQTPCRESRITLSPTEMDAFGMPRAVVSVVFNPGDIESLLKSVEMFAERFRSRDLGEFTYSPEELRNYLVTTTKGINSSAHQLGTTRMSIDPATGVVDADAKVHGISNLHVAGSAVFPTGGHANPTMTALAQALRLADHLKKR